MSARRRRPIRRHEQAEYCRRRAHATCRMGSRLSGGRSRDGCSARADSTRARPRWRSRRGRIRTAEGGSQRRRLDGSYGSWAAARVGDLAEAGISGFVLKARSPSCGRAGVLVHDDPAAPVPTGRGLFAEALAAVMPGLPTIDEETLEDRGQRERFLQTVRAFAASRGA